MQASPNQVLGRSHKNRSQGGGASGILCRDIYSTDRGDNHLVLEDSWPLNSQGSDGKCELTMSSLVAFNFNLGVQCYDFSTIVNSVFSTLKATSYGTCPLHQQMKIEIATTQAVTAGATIRTALTIVFIVYTSPELGTPGILTIASIALTALLQLRQ